MDSRKESQGLLALTLVFGFLAFAWHTAEPFAGALADGTPAGLFLSILVLACLGLARLDSPRRQSPVWDALFFGWSAWVVGEGVALSMALGASGLPVWAPGALKLVFYPLAFYALLRAKQFYNVGATMAAKWNAFGLTAGAVALSLYGLYGQITGLDLARHAFDIVLIGASLYAFFWSKETEEEEKPFKWIGLGFACLASYGLFVLVTTALGVYEELFYAVDALFYASFAFLALGAEKQVKLGA
ncbi:MAG: hypothetical protein WC607_03170 [Candidatus Micrarchaeia archaeon]